MTTQVTINDPAKAKYFEAKMAFTTGPVELERMMKNNEVDVVDVRAAVVRGRTYSGRDQPSEGSVACTESACARTR